MKQDAIAIIGMACRFPGAPNVNAFLDLLSQGHSPLREIPSHRWQINDYYHPVDHTPGKMYVRHGYFLDEIDQFDPVFFRMSPKEAMHLDPQHRLLLEVTYEAIMHANQ